MKTLSVETLFFQGSYQKVLDEVLDRARKPVTHAERKWVIGALCFVGRKEEAEALYLEFGDQVSVRADDLFHAASRFFLGVAFCRHGHYSKARKYFAENLKENRAKEGLPVFFAWQGLAFYHYFCARFSKSEKVAHRALAHASFSSLSYGRTLALDIIGHSLVQQGYIRAGLAQLENARLTAESLGNGGLSDSIRISHLVYSAQFGVMPKSSVRALQTARKKLHPQNSYAHANLLLELSNQYMLRGQLAYAAGALNEASSLIYGSQHRRYAQVLTLRFAEVAYRRGEYASALSAVQLQRSQLDPKYDRLNLLMALGIEVKILEALKIEGPIELLKQQITRLTRDTSRGIALQIESRNHKNRVSTASINGEDSIAQVLNQLQQKRARAYSAILRSEFKGFIYRALELAPGSCWILASKSELFVLDHGEVSFIPVRVPDLLLHLIEALARGQRSKQELITELWGYSYHPLRHDPLLYQAIARLRDLLGKQSELIEVANDGYRLRRGFRFQRLGDLEISEEGLSEKAPQSFVSRPSLGQAAPISKELNTRQIRLLELLEIKRFLGVRDCLKQFKVSDMTLKRDFAELVEGGWVSRLGRARATRYVLANYKQM